MGLLGITVPEEYGGAGADVTAACIVHEELVRRFFSFTPVASKGSFLYFMYAFSLR